MSSEEFFCPKSVSFSPEDPEVMEVLSVCSGRDQRILRYSYPPYVVNMKLYFNLLSSVPLNFAYQDPTICSMGDEFVVLSNLNGKGNYIHSVGINDDRNDWSLGTNDLDLGYL